ncbi:MAG: hypothetical protein KDD56_09550, partial [Bdellovibrionales bacterium]|nr:hypothetical protein [Bdellovibrionales bacterium]
MLTGLKKGTRNVVTIAALLIPGCGDANKQENNKQEPTDKATATNVLEPEPDLNTSTLPKNPDLEIETEHDALAKAEENDLSETDINKQEPTSDLKTKKKKKMSASDIEYNKAHNALDKWMTFYNRWLPENST